jgi:8-oxo-dGTP pyrophosphatase MutT (NUDIX family)
MNSPLRVDVVTAFLENDNRILILRRSTKVRTMKGKWGAVSGYLEDLDPLAQAIVEIKEETGLSNDDIQFIRSGHVIEARDPDSSNIVYIVHPHLFHSKSREIVLSSEHDRYTWAALNELSSYETVPNLLEACKRVVVANNTIKDVEEQNS